MLVKNTLLPAQTGTDHATKSSASVTVDVQSTQIPTQTVYPMPTEYWSEPVSQAGHAAWSYVTGDWLGQAIAPNYQGTQIPENNIGGIINDYTYCTNNSPHCMD